MTTNNFWTQPGIEPKRKFRWLLYFAGAPQFIIKSVTKPSFQINSSSHNFLQHQFHFPGRVTWQDISVTLVDPVDPDATLSMYNIIKSSGYELPGNVMTSPGGKKTVSKKAMVESLGNYIRIDQIGPTGADEIIESWRINNPMITSVNFDGLDYGADEALNIQIGIKYDWAELNPEGKGIPNANFGTGWTDDKYDQN